MDFFEHIESYIDGSIDLDIKSKMEQAMEADPSLRQAVDNYPTASKISESLIELDVLAKLESLDQESGSETKKTDQSKQTDSKTESSKVESKAKNPNRFLWLAIIFALLASLFYFFADSVEPETNEEGVNPIYAMGYQKPIDPDALKSVDVLKKKNDFVLGKKYFSLNEFQKSEQSFVKAINSTKNTDTISQANFWLAHVYMNAKEWAAAREALKETNHPNKQDLTKILDRLE